MTIYYKTKAKRVGLGATAFGTPNPCVGQGLRHGLGTTRGTPKTTILALVVYYARRNVPMLLFLAIWLCGWAVGEVMVPMSTLAKMTSIEQRLAKRDI